MAYNNQPPSALRFTILGWLRQAAESEFGVSVPYEGVTPETMVGYINAVRHGLPQYTGLSISMMGQEVWIVKKLEEKL